MRTGAGSLSFHEGKSTSLSGKNGFSSEEWYDGKVFGELGRLSI